MELNRWKSNTSTQGNYFRVITSYEEFLSVWDFLLEGFDQLVDAKGANMQDLTVQELFKTMLELAVYPNKGLLGILFNKKDVPLGYIAAYDTTIAFRPRELSIFGIYSNGKCPSTSKELMFELRNWARKQEFKSLRARMYKRSGAAMRFFVHILKLRHTGMVFECDL